MKKFCSYLSITVIVTVVCICMNGCSSVSIPETTPPPTRTNPAEEVTETHLTLQSGIRIDEYALKSRPKIDPLMFEPVQGSQDEILAKHDGERQKKPSDNSFFDGAAFGKSLLLNSQELVAQQTIHTDNELEKISINVLLDDKIIYTAQAGIVSPITSLQGLWGYNGHWILEIAYIDRSIDTTNTATFNVTGQIVQDGKLLNEEYNYQEMFAFQLIKDKPFYFFKQAVQIGISYDGEEMPLTYDELPHYGCCSAAALNPKASQNMIAFFAYRNDSWYYVEVGVYD